MDSRKIGLFLLLLMSSLFAQDCMFDSNLGRPVCIDSPSLAFFHTTPDKHLEAMKRGLADVADGRRVVAGITASEAAYFLADLVGEKISPVAPPVEEEIVLPAPPPQNATRPAQGTRSNNCLNELERDWMAYCQSALAGFDCLNANPSAKAAIVKNWEAIHNCVHVR